MTKNEQSAANLQWWIRSQNEMKETAQNHLESLRKLVEKNTNSSGTDSGSQWITDVIARQRETIESIKKSIAVSEACLQLALAERLHDPRNG